MAQCQKSSAEEGPLQLLQECVTDQLVLLGGRVHLQSTPFITPYPSIASCQLWLIGIAIQ